MRYRFVRDDDFHWYLIEADQYDKFHEWLEWTSNYCEGDYDGPHFSDLGGGIYKFTFLDPRRDD